MDDLMHQGAHGFVRRVAETLPKVPTIYEVGGRDFNGGVRDLFDAEEYVSVDLYDGTGVDVVQDFTYWRPDAQAQVIVCCEVLEHSPYSERILRHAHELLEPGGHLILTCASYHRAPHSGVDGLKVRPNEWYANIDPDWLHHALQVIGFQVLEFEHRPSIGDLYAFAQKEE